MPQRIAGMEKKPRRWRPRLPPSTECDRGVVVQVHATGFDVALHLQTGSRGLIVVHAPAAGANGGPHLAAAGLYDITGRWVHGFWDLCFDEPASTGGQVDEPCGESAANGSVWDKIAAGCPSSRSRVRTLKG